MREIIRAENLGKTFQSGEKTLTVLEGVNLSVARGESLSIVGPSGSGKSTLLSLLAGLDRPTRGRVWYDGTDLSGLSEAQLSRLWGKKIGFVFQAYYLLPALTAEENVRAPLEIARSRDTLLLGTPYYGVPKSKVSLEEQARLWLSKVGLLARAEHLPSQLSGGEQQRVALARAMVCRPEVLFADEPTGNLDTRTGKEMEEVLFSLVREQKTTLILVTHEASFAQRADRVISMEGGKVL